MILMGRILCLPSPATVHELFSVARDASILPDVSLDPVLTTFLSLDSSAALQHQYAYAQRGMSREQRAVFNQSLASELGGSKVTNGGVGVIALALSLLFDQVVHQVQIPTGASLSSHTAKTKRIFGISTTSRIGLIIQDYLRLVPGVANDEEKMAEMTELYDNWLKLELVDHFERMTTKKRMSTVSMQQWLTGAAFHLHMRIHQVRLHSVPPGSVRSLRVSYKTGFNHLIQGYTAYLRRNIRETAALGSERKRSRAASRPKQTSTSNQTSMTGSASRAFNISLGGLSERTNASTALNVTAGIGKCCDAHVSTADFVLNVTNRLSVDDKPKNTLDSSAARSSEEGDGVLGQLVIEPLRNMSHTVKHHECESPAIEQALVTRIINALDLERHKNFFTPPEKVLQGLYRQTADFELSVN